MITRKRSFLLAIASVCFLLSSMPVTATQQSQLISVYYPSMHFVFDGQELAPPKDQSGFIYEGTTYVPLRFVSYALNKGVEWDPETYTVSIAPPTKQQEVEIQDYRLNREVRESIQSSTGVTVPDPKQIEVYFEKVQYLFDNQPKQPSQNLPGLIYEDSLYVPMRFFSESIGKKIDWDPVTYTVSATALEATINPEPKPTPQPTVKPTSTHPTVTAPGGAMGGGGISKPSYDSLKGSADAKIKALEADATSYFINLWLSSLSATPDQKKALKAQGETKLREFDNRFENILTDFQGALSTYGYSTDIISTYRQEYETKKSTEKAKLGID